MTSIGQVMSLQLVRNIENRSEYTGSVVTWTKRNMRIVNHREAHIQIVQIGISLGVGLDLDPSFNDCCHTL